MLLLTRVMTPPTRVPQQFDELPEPGRTKAFEFFQELMASGSQSEPEAIKEALKRAQSWIAERAQPAH